MNICYKDSRLLAAKEFAKGPSPYSARLGDYSSSANGGLTFAINLRSEAPKERKLRRACVKLSVPFGPPRTSFAS